MADMDLLIQKSTKKILKLVKNLPDRSKLEASLLDGKPNSRKKRFVKHPRGIHPRVEFCDEDSPNSTCRESGDELENAKGFAVDHEHEPRTDSSDEYCDVTFRSESVRPTCSRVKSGSGDVSKDTSESSRYEKKTVSREKPITKPTHRKLCHHAKKRRELQRCLSDVASSSSDPKELKIYVEPRIKVLWDRSVKLLKECRLIFESGIGPPDGYEDLERRKRRNFEFASRFARIYLYQTNRLVIDLENIVRPPSGKRTKPITSMSLAQKFFAAFQTIYLALEAYYKHLPTGIVNGMPEKFRDLLELELKLSDMYHDICDNLPHEDNGIDVFDIHCNSMLIDEALVPQSSAKYNTKLCVSKYRIPSSTVESRLSMYSVPVRKDVNWKNSVAALAKKKYQVPSKYKTATFKHRPPPNQEPEQSKPSKPAIKTIKRAAGSKTAHRSQAQKLRASSFSIMDIDDNVTTYLQETEKAERQTSTKSSRKASMPLRAHAEGFFHKVSSGNQKMTKIEYDCILDHFLEIIGEEKIPSMPSKELTTQKLIESKFGRSIDNMTFPEFVENLVNYANSRTSYATNYGRLEVQTDGYGYDFDDAVRSIPSRSRTISITGTSNAQLLCMRDQTQSISELSSDQPSQIHTLDPEGHLRRKLSELTVSQRPNSKELIYKEREVCDDDDDLSMEVSQGAIPRHIKKKKHATFAVAEARAIKPGPKKAQLVPLQMLPRKTILSVIEYKLQYHKEAKNNYMYKKSGDIQPWLLVKRVADTLLEECLLSVARDIQVEHILKKIYTEEFK